jgi:Zn-dependent peptidase ImmA (M78 family)
MRSRKNVAQLASKVLDKVDFDSLPIPIIEIAEEIGLKVVPFDFPEEISGVLKKEKRIIGVNKRHHGNRMRFTIAHELGHFLLGHGVEREEDIVEKDFDEGGRKEREANIFASEILMPEMWVKNIIDKEGKDVTKLAKDFQVSPQAMTIRLMELNLL